MLSHQVHDLKDIIDRVREKERNREARERGEIER